MEARHSQPLQKKPLRGAVARSKRADYGQLTAAIVETDQPAAFANYNPSKALPISTQGLRTNFLRKEGRARPSQEAVVLSQRTNN